MTDDFCVNKNKSKNSEIDVTLLQIFGVQLSSYMFCEFLRFL